MPSRKRAAQPVDLLALLPSLREALAAQKALKAADLTRLGIPKAQHAEALEKLRADGFEVAGAVVRVPIAKQIQRVVEERKIVPLAELAKLVKGAKAAETKRCVAELGLPIAIRGRIEAVVDRSVPAFSREQVAALVRACKDLAQRGAKAAKRAGGTLLVDDVREPLVDLLAPRRAPARTVELVDAVISELSRHVRDSVGLSFVPDAVRALASSGFELENVQAALLAAARAGRIELQPESGLNRLTREELELCPPGPQGTRLTWARLAEGTR